METPLFNEYQPEEVKNDVINDFPNIARMAQRFPIKNSQNAYLFPDDPEMNYQASMTIPDQAMSIREIMERYARGIPFDNVKTPIYNGDDDFPDITHMDLADREAYINEREAELRTLKQSIKEAYDAREAEKIAQARQAEQDKLNQQRQQQEAAPDPAKPL